MEEKLEKAASKVLDLLGIKGVSLDVFLVPDDVMHKINREYHGKDKETNILSFEEPDIPHPDSELRHIGEIYLAPDYISAHNEDIVRLLVHGILHLLGYDHERGARAARVMEKKEQEIIEKAGF
ncbi:MAG: rRNA maturation RNase YbeY [Candidatus Colwellbacteria bacterium]|jgi:probable rRNA maturation factor|nr:rRNA maturation RNase YbeY [Candidatus Colwellbacteria bacterium]